MTKNLIMLHGFNHSFLLEVLKMIYHSYFSEVLSNDDNLPVNSAIILYIKAIVKDQIFK